MKKIIAIVFLFVGVVGVMGQDAVGDWNTQVTTGNWNNNTTWAICIVGGNPGTFTSAGSGVYPGSSGGISKAVTILDGATVTATGHIIGTTGGELVVAAGGTLNCGTNRIYGDVSNRFPLLTINGTLTTSTYVVTNSFTLGSSGIFETSYGSSQGWWYTVYNPSTVSLNGTIIFTGLNQDIPAYEYSNLTLSNTGLSTLKGNVTVNGILSIGASSTVDMLDNDLTISGSGIINNGIFRDNGTQSNLGSLYFTGSTQSISGGGTFPSNFYYLAAGDPFSGSCELTMGNTNEISFSNGVFDGTLNIQPTSKVSFENLSLDNSNMGNCITLESSATSTASLIISSSLGSNPSGTDAIAQRYITGSKFHVLSSPVSGQAIDDFITTNSIDPNNANTYYAMTDYVEGTNNWASPYYSVASPPTSNMITGTGYLAGIVTSAAVSFTGTPHVGSQSISIVNSGAGLAWNAVGNPYTSSINVATLISNNSSILDGSYGGIYVYNGTSYPPVTTGYIQPGQGFFVKAGTGGSFGFTSAMQAHENPTFYKKSSGIEEYAEVEEYAEIKLLVTSEGVTDASKVRLYPDQTYGLDPGKDLGKFKGGGMEFLLYSQLLEDNGIDFAVQALPEDSIEKMSIPIGLDYTDGGSVTFSSEIIGLPAGTRVILEDRLMDKFIDLEAPSASYTVDIPAEESGYGRFYLYTFDASAIGAELNDLKNFTIFANDKVVYINGRIDDFGMASVYDMMGKEQKQVELVSGNRNTISLKELSEGIYIIRLMNGNEIHSEKFFLK